MGGHIIIHMTDTALREAPLGYCVFFIRYLIGQKALYIFSKTLGEERLSRIYKINYFKERERENLPKLQHTITLSIYVEFSIHAGELIQSSYNLFGGEISA